MRRTRHLALALAAATVIAVALLAAFGASADRPLGVASLSGTFHFTVSEIREEIFPAPETVYCNSYGQIFFDGAGHAEVLDGSGYGVCSNGDNPFKPDTFTYTVDAIGSVMLTELSSPSRYTTHCQLLDKGTVLLCDGTGGIGGTRNPEQLIFHATAVKL